MAEAATASAAAELAAVRESLVQATRTFTERLERGGAELERSRIAAARTLAETPPTRPHALPPQPPPPFAGARPAPAPADPQREAQAYVEEAKRRVDRLIAAANAAVERETAEIRAAAERDAAERRRRAAAGADAMVDEARLVAERIVAERQRRVGALSDGVIGRAEALTAGLEDAARVREQFDAFARALAAAADRIARSAA